MTSPPAMVDSPSWAYHDHLHAERVLTRGTSSCTVRAAYDQNAGHWRLQPHLAEPAAAQLASFSTADLDVATPAPIRHGLARLDGLQRLGAGSYFEALGTAVIRQVIRAAQARRVWHRLAAALTQRGNAVAQFPTEERFLAASDGELAEAGLGFKTRALRAVAEACQSEQHHWDQLAQSNCTAPG